MKSGGSTVPLALDLVLKNFLKSPAFTDLQEKNWGAISRTIPGTTPKQVQRRYEELYQQSLAAGMVVGGSRPLSQGSTSSTRGPVRSDGEQRSSRPGSAKFKAKGDKDTTSGKSEDKRPGSADQSFLVNYLKKKMPKYKLKYVHAYGADLRDSQSFSAFPSINAQMWQRLEESIRRTTARNVYRLLNFTVPALEKFCTGKLSPINIDPVMVIHVCDEAKNLKQDFHCPRDLLVKEMRYFAEYLTTDAQRWEEVDISVHCDVQIFDWLMDYVKRGTIDNKDSPRLEPNNVISILISSDFLKMDNLVAECIEYCHINMSAIVATPCNMNCINDKLVGRISDLFNHNEADAIKDRKDKFKSKLFAKKLEKLFDPEYSNPDSPECAASLYKCSICSKILTKSLERKVKCLHSRMQIDRSGSLSYNHIRDTNWDVNDYLLDLKHQLKTWRDVYWRIWGTINSLPCSRCHETFACTELGHCRYHPDSPTYDLNMSESGVRQSVIGMYPCCSQKTLRFDPTQPNTGCKVRDHVVNMADAIMSMNAETVTKEPTSTKSDVYDDLLAHRDAVSMPYTPPPPPSTKDDMELNVFARDEQASTMKDVISSTKKETDGDDATKSEARPQPRLQALTVERSINNDDDFGMGESEDELGDDEEGKSDADSDQWKTNMMVLRGVTSWMKLRKTDLEEDTGKRKLQPESNLLEAASATASPKIVRKPRPPRKSKVTVDPQAILLDAPDFGSTKMRKWDSSRSMRWNQDAQREEDQRRMYEMVTYLTKLRVVNDKIDKQKQREYAGGLYCKLEAQWKAINMPPPRTTGAQIRSKPRLNTLKTTLN